MSGNAGQLALGLEVAEPAWILTGRLRAGDVIQTRDHSGGKLWTSRVVEVRVRWRLRRGGAGLGSIGCG